MDARATHESERLQWLGGRAGAPTMAEASQMVESSLGGAVAVTSEGAPVSPERVVTALGHALRRIHAVPIEGCPYTASTAARRDRVTARLVASSSEPATDGPYVGRAPRELLDVLDALLAELRPDDRSFVHGDVDLASVWLAPDDTMTLVGWYGAGVGDRHLDLAAAATSVHDHWGPAFVAPMFDAYGIDRIDLRRLDAHQLLDHLDGVG